jgi:hypothetical protein
MVARTHPLTGLTVTFDRSGQPLVVVAVTDGIEARRQVLKLVSDTERLQSGDKIFVTAFNDEELPEVNRGSHYS